MIAAGSSSHNQYNLFFPDNQISKIKHLVVWDAQMVRLQLNITYLTI